VDRDGQPVAKKPRMDDSGIVREGDIPDMHREEEAGEEDEGGEEPDDDDVEDGDEVEERPETEEQIEDPEQHEAEDEALDNGEDSD
jgi:DNA polymerase epsilon subunit 3